MSHWATHAIDTLRLGNTVQIRPRGHSMKGKVGDGDLVTLAPYSDADPEVGDIVLATVRGKVYLHLVRAIRDHSYQIGNNRGHINGWAGRGNIHGKAVKVEP